MHCAQRAVVFGGGINQTIVSRQPLYPIPPPQKKKKTRHNQVDPDVEAAYCFRWVAFLHV